MNESGEPDRQTEDAQIRRQAVAAMMQGGCGVLHVRGNCMAPVLEHGQEVELGPGKPWPGDIVAFSRGDGRIVVHRFLMKRPWFDRASKEWVWLAVTRPDQGSDYDPEVPTESLLGIVGKVRAGGQIEDGEPPFRSLRIGALDRIQAVAWAVRYIIRRAVRVVGRGRSDRHEGRLP